MYSDFLRFILQTHENMASLLLTRVNFTISHLLLECHSEVPIFFSYIYVILHFLVCTYEDGIGPPVRSQRDPFQDKPFLDFDLEDGCGELYPFMNIQRILGKASIK